MDGIPDEFIPDEDYVLRNVHFAQYKRWNAKRIPTESDFTLRPNEDGLSVNWEKYCSLNSAFLLLGVQKDKNDNFRNPSDFKILRLNVGQIRRLVSDDSVDVKHNPLAINHAHSLVCYEDEEEIRLKLCDLVATVENPLLTIDFKEIEGTLEAVRLAAS